MQNVFILGAGASVFGGFPLSNRLLTFLSRYLDGTREKVPRDSGKRFFRFVEKVAPFLPQKWKFENGNPDLEFVLAIIERSQQKNDTESAVPLELLDDLDRVIIKLDLDAVDLYEVRRDFKIIITFAFQTHSYQLLCTENCEKSDAFTAVSEAWTNKASDGDSIISFNWDLLHETLMCKAGKWMPYDGYGIPYGQNKYSNSSTIKLFKLHGSCNWALRYPEDQALNIDDISTFFCWDEIINDERLPDSTSYYGDSLIVPSYLKNPYKVSILDRVWSQAQECMASADKIFVCGYSLPEADYHATALIEAALNQNHNISSLFLVLGSDDRAYERWAAVCKKTNINYTPVRKRFEDFVIQNHF
jgi:hypothetical protein